MREDRSSMNFDRGPPPEGDHRIYLPDDFLRDRLRSYRQPEPVSWAFIKALAVAVSVAIPIWILVALVAMAVLP